MMTTEAFQSDNILTGETFEELTLRHKKELKELNAKTTALKRTATKGDKKRKKEVQNEIAKLEAELHKRQEEEVRQFQQSSNKNDPSGKASSEEIKV
jgi:OTU domain-containing protein 6